jgi:hypothetical protein
MPQNIHQFRTVLSMRINVQALKKMGKFSTSSVTINPRKIPVFLTINSYPCSKFVLPYKHRK